MLLQADPTGLTLAICLLFAAASARHCSTGCNKPARHRHPTPHRRTKRPPGPKPNSKRCAAEGLT